ncbi:hypothetical protein D3C86_1513300 [compost metagenome]
MNTKVVDRKTGRSIRASGSRGYFHRIRSVLCRSKRNVVCSIYRRIIIRAIQPLIACSLSYFCSCKCVILLRDAIIRQGSLSNPDFLRFPVTFRIFLCYQVVFTGFCYGQFGGSLSISYCYHTRWCTPIISHSRHIQVSRKC